MKIKGLYTKKGWYYYQPTTDANGNRPKAIALRTKVEQDAINLSFDEQERFQLVAASVDGRMFQAIDHYLEAKAAVGDHGGKTGYNTGKALRQICEDLGNPKLNELTETKLVEWAKALRARNCRVALRPGEKPKEKIKERKGKHVSDSTVAAYSRMFRAFINWIHANGRILKNPAKKLPSGKSKKTKKARFVTFLQRDLMLETVTRPDLAFIYHVGFLAGLRFGEILAMEPDWLWFNEEGTQGTIFVQETEFWKPKDREARAVHMPPLLVEFLSNWPIEGRFVLMPQKTVFPKPPKYRYDPSTSFQKHAANCGAARFSYHDLRHSYGAHLIERGATVAEVAALLGDDVTVTEKHYAGLRPARHNVVAVL